MFDKHNRKELKRYTPDDPEFYMLVGIVFLVSSVLFAFLKYQNLLNGSLGSKIVIEHFGQRDLDYLVYSVSVISFCISLFSFCKLFRMQTSSKKQCDRLVL